ncbi:MAG: hypothetical protein LBU53_07635 [Zoogloeaceae bacterium]|jgi:hypothetical protein|nr:hypothetical protein [Zoogloeaceae bacterium]
MSVIEAFLVATCLPPGVNGNLAPDLDKFSGITGWPGTEDLGAAGGYMPMTAHFPVEANGKTIAAWRGGCYFDDYYHRIHITPASIDVGNIAAEQKIDLSIWNSALTPQTLTAVTGLDDDITVTTPFALPFAMPALREDLHQLNLSPSGPSTIDLEIHFVFTGLPDAIVAIVGNRIVAFPWPVNWVEPVRENFQWTTDILTSETGAEQRRALRISPRVRLSGAALVAEEERANLDLALSNWAANVWCVPFWPDIQTLAADAPKGSTFISCVTAGYDFAVGSLALLIGESPFDNEAVEVTAIAAHGIEIKRPTGFDWRAGTRLFPARQARLMTLPEVTRETDTVDTLAVEFQLTETRDRTGKLPTPTYRGLPLFLDRPNEADKLTRAQERLIITLDNEVGKVAVIDTARRAFQTLQHSFLLAGRAALQDFLDFVYGLNGKQKAIWVPTHAADLTLIEPASANALAVKRVGYPRFGLGTPGRQDILIQMHDGSVLTRRVTAAVSDGNVERLAVDTPFPAAILPSQVARISYLICARLASDEIEVEHLTDNHGVARASLTWRAVRDDLEST